MFVFKILFCLELQQCKIYCLHFVENNIAAGSSFSFKCIISMFLA